MRMATAAPMSSGRNTLPTSCATICATSASVTSGEAPAGLAKQIAVSNADTNRIFVSDRVSTSRFPAFIKTSTLWETIRNWRLELPPLRFALWQIVADRTPGPNAPMRGPAQNKEGAG
jgi:hypothetical protein